MERLLRGATFDGCSCLTAAPEYGNGYAIEVETGLFLYGLVRRLQPCVVVETGTHRGYSTAWILSALADNHAIDKNMPKGHCWTVDRDLHGGDALRLWSDMGIAQYATWVIASSWEVNFTLPRPIDLLWLDAEHDLFSVTREYAHFGPQLAPTAHIIFHDTANTAEMPGAVQDVARMATNEGRSVQHWSMRNLRGLDILCLTKK